MGYIQASLLCMCPSASCQIEYNFCNVAGISPYPVFYSASPPCQKLWSGLELGLHRYILYGIFWFSHPISYADYSCSPWRALHREQIETAFVAWMWLSNFRNLIRSICDHVRHILLCYTHANPHSIGYSGGCLEVTDIRIQSVTVVG